VGTKKTRILSGMQTMKTRLRRLQMGIRTLLGTGIEDLCLIF
jgi:hypothetical protein